MMKNNILIRLSFADIFTILNGIFGLLSIFFALQGKKHPSLIFVLLAVLADGMDGIVARKYGGFIGKYMDEFADIVSFCVAPCVFVFIFYSQDAIFLLPSIIFLIFGMLHLVNYHISEKEYFIGLTTPASAIMITSLAYLSFPFWLIIIFFIVLAILMVFPILYPRIEKHFAAIACIIIFLAMIRKEFVFLLLVSTLIYIIIGPLYVIYKMRQLPL